MRATRAITRCSIPSAARGPRNVKPRPKQERNRLFRRTHMTRTLATVFTAGALLFSAAPARAHHAFAAEFDADKPVKFMGTVTKMEWINPHAWIHIDVKGEDGKVTPWMI